MNIVAYGGGTNSTPTLIGMYHHDICPAAVTMESENEVPDTPLLFHR